jgi:hypothetical protein
MRFDFSARRLKSGGCLAIVLLGVSGCASPAPFRAHYADIGRGALANYRGTGPLIVEFAPGDRVPVELDIESQDFDLVPAQPPLELVAKRRVFVRFGGDGVRASSDGVNFDEKPVEPGKFSVGFHATKTSPTTLQVRVTAPKR